MAEEKAGGFISKIIFNNGEYVDIQQNDIVIFVGPNNVGKSQALKDIYTLSSKKLPSVVISDIEIKKSTLSVSSVLDKVCAGKSEGTYTSYKFLKHNFVHNSDYEKLFFLHHYFGDYCDLFVANLDTSARLTICEPPKSISRNANKEHPIHYAAFDSKYRKWLSDNFQKAFGIKVTPNIHYGAIIPLCIGNPVKLDGEYEDEQARQEEYIDILDTYRHVQNQGDGIKSFTGILLYLMLDHFCTYLIDEPESFLHPPQARIMGQIIGQTLTDKQQAFISTHSEDTIKGLLEICPNRIKIIRITREEDINMFSVLKNEKFNEVWNDPLLKYSNIMSSLFHKAVVLCESDSDCKMYSIIESFNKKSSGQYSETLFIHCGGKHRMAKISIALRALNIDIKIIPDIDIMNEETVFRGVVEAFDIKWATIKRDYNQVVSNLHSAKENVDREEAKTNINTILNKSKSKELSKRELDEIRLAVSTISIWDAIKKSGIPAIPSGDATSAFIRMDRVLREGGIFIVPVGEIECFIKEIGGHGNEWVNNVLETYPDLNNIVFTKIREFLKDMNL